MFSNFSDRVLKTFDGLLSRGVLTENDVNSAMREIRVALLEADVSINVAKDFIEKVKPKALGKEIIRSTIMIGQNLMLVFRAMKIFKENLLAEIIIMPQN